MKSVLTYSVTSYKHFFLVQPTKTIAGLWYIKQISFASQWRCEVKPIHFFFWLNTVEFVPNSAKKNIIVRISVVIVWTSPQTLVSSNGEWSFP